MAVAFCLSPAVAPATQWHEPFDQQVIEAADALVEAEVVDVASSRLKIVKVLAGKPVPDEIGIAGFGFGGYYGEHGLADLNWEPGLKIHALLTEAEDGSGWTLPTPTSGVARPFGDGLVLGSFRISCAGALFKEAEYGRVQSLLFRVLHRDASAEPELAEFVRTELGREVEYFGGEGDPKDALGFFRQNAALEILAMRPELAPDLNLTPFLGAKDQHAQISAVRALAARPESGQALIDLLATGEAHEVAQLVAARALFGRPLDRKQRSILSKLARKASDEALDLCGGSIMDPRLVEGFSGVSVREALRELLGKQRR